MGEHPWLVVLRRQRSRFTLLILTILHWRGVAKQPQGNEWDSNSGDLQNCSQNTADALLCRNFNSQTPDDRNKCRLSWFFYGVLILFSMNSNINTPLICLTCFVIILGGDFLHSLMCCIIIYTDLTHPPIRDNFPASCIRFTSCVCNTPSIGSIVYRVLNFMQLQHECCKTVWVSLKHRETLFGPTTVLDLEYSCITIHTKINMIWLN